MITSVPAILRRVTPLLCVAATFATPARAWETDQITGRGADLPDVTEAADARVNELLADAVDRANRRLKCRGAPTRVHRVLARQIRVVTSRDTPVEGRGALRALGYGAYAAWLESADLPRRAYLLREDVFGGIPMATSFILSKAGTSSTVRLAGVLTGTDKPDHFFETGWRYWRRSGQGRHPERAVRWGTWTENTFLGRVTSKGFSYADLHANWQGYRFYAGLLDADGPFALDEDGCVEQVRPFTWRDHVDWRWDEVLYPTVYTRKVAAWIASRLDADPDRYCAGVETWGEEVAARLAEAFAEGEVPWVGRNAPPRHDPFRIVERCTARSER